MARAQGSIERAIRKRVADHPDDTWLKGKDGEFSWREVLANIHRAANGLLDLGVRPGERVALLLPNGPEFVWAHLGIIFIGAHSVPVNTSQRGQTLAHILSDSDAVAAILHEDLRWRPVVGQGFPPGAAVHGGARRQGRRRDRLGLRSPHEGHRQPA